MQSAKLLLFFALAGFATCIPFLHSISKDVQLDLYLQKNPDISYAVQKDSDAPFLRKATVLVLIHGWLDNSNALWVHDMKEKYLSNYNNNFITVDWRAYSRWEYNLAAVKANQIGSYIGDVLASLVKRGKIQAANIHIVGHGLGAHIAGFAGQRVHHELKTLVGRVTGLDPVSGLFEIPVLLPQSQRLSKLDATYVDVIHTSARVYGMVSPIGHADFYPNDGKNQPGCPLVGEKYCSYNRAYLLFLESITSKNFVATQCSSWKKYHDGKCDDNETVSMGLLVDTSKTGKFYLATNSKSPYAMGQVSEPMDEPEVNDSTEAQPQE